MTDHPDTDLNDPLGEAEALRRENADLRRINQNLRQIERNVQAERERQFRRAEAAEAALAAHQDALVWCSGSDDFQEDGKARAGWLRLCAPLIHQAALAASRAPDPVANAGSCKPGDLISRAAAIAACEAHLGNTASLTSMPPQSSAAWEIRNDLRALPAAPVAEAQPATGKEVMQRGTQADQFDASPGVMAGAELDALVEELWESDAASALTNRAARAITALRAQPDWKAMTERLGKKLTKLDGELDTNGYQAEGVMRRLVRAALSDLAKMKDNTK